MLLAVQPICALAVQPIWSMIADRTGKRKQVLVVLCVASAAVSLAYYAGGGFAASLVTTLAFAMFFQALLPLSDSLVIEASERSGIDFSRVRMGGTIGYAVVVAIIGHVLEAAPVFQFVIVSTALLAFAFQVSRLPGLRGGGMASPKGIGDTRNDDGSSRPAEKSNGTAQGGKGFSVGLLAIFDTRDIYYVLALAFVDFLGLGFLGTFLGSWCIEIGYGQDLVGTLSSISAASEIPILLVSAALIRRFGEIRLLAFSCLAMAARLLLVGSGVVPVMMLGQLLQSLSYMTVYFSCVTFISRHTYPNTRARGQSVLAMIQSGLAMVISNVLGGWLCDTFGMAVTFRLFAIVLVVGLIVVLLIMAAHRTSR